MTVAYVARLYNTDGILQAVFDKWVSLNITHSVNGFGTHTLYLDGTDNRTLLFGTDYLLQVMRKMESLNVDWYQEYLGFHRTPQRQLTDLQKDNFVSYGRSLLDLIHRREILFPPPNNLSGPGETVIKTIVENNAGPSATVANGRIEPGVTQGLSIQTDDGEGEQWEGERSYRNLLETIQEISILTFIDFDVLLASGLDGTPPLFQFATFYPQRGTDRTANNTLGNVPVVFSLSQGNMVDPSYTIGRTEEITVLVGLGQGQEDDREVWVSRLANENISPWNHIEATHDARNVDTLQALADETDMKLEELQAKESFTFRILQTPASAYGLHYFVGDVVTARFKNIERDIKIVGANITVRDGKEEIDLELSQF